MSKPWHVMDDDEFEEWADREQAHADRLYDEERDRQAEEGGPPPWKRPPKGDEDDDGA